MAISKNRRADGERAGGFPGADIIFRQVVEGVSKQHVGLLPQGCAPTHEGGELYNADDEK